MSKHLLVISVVILGLAKICPALPSGAFTWDFTGFDDGTTSDPAGWVDSNNAFDIQSSEYVTTGNIGLAYSPSAPAGSWGNSFGVEVMIPAGDIEWDFAGAAVLIDETDGTFYAAGTENGDFVMKYWDGNDWQYLGSELIAPYSIPGAKHYWIYDVGNGQLNMLATLYDTHGDPLAQLSATVTDTSSGRYMGLYSGWDNTSGAAAFDDFHSFFTIIPEPMTIALLGLGGLMLARRKR